MSAEPRAPKRHAAAWTADGSATVELERLSGPRHGLVDPPAHLLREPPAPGARWDLDRVATKVRLYELCLTRGCPFDIYRWVNLDDLLRLWDVLDLPASVAAPWVRALREAGLSGEHAVDVPRQRLVRRARTRRGRPVRSAGQ